MKVARLWIGASLALASASACQEETLTRLTPTISVCAAPQAPQQECDRPIDLGDVPVDSDVPVTIVLREIGGARVDIVEVTASDPAVVFGEVPVEVPAGREVALPFSLALLPDALGPRAVNLTIRSSDPNRPEVVVELLLNGVPKLAPDILVCFTNDDGEEVCGTELDVSFGVVRRTQARGVTLLVKNVGNLPLAIEEVRLEGETSIDGEVTIATSTRPARLDADREAPLVVVYAPADGGSDDITLVIACDDEDAPTVEIRLHGEGQDNAPPVADAFEAVSLLDEADAVVDDVVQLDGNDSADPEGDPLVYEWQLAAPQGSAAALDDAAAVRVAFAPDVAGTYVATLTVRDSLGQEGAATVTINAAPRFGLRAVATWDGSVDIDVHLVEQGAALFSTRDCHFDNRSVDFGALGEGGDDCELLDDAVAGPGPEQAAIVAPVGAYQIWAHVFDDGGAGAAVSVRIALDDAAVPALLETRQLAGDCTAWHVADVAFPSGDVTLLDTVETLCP